MQTLKTAIVALAVLTLLVTTSCTNPKNKTNKAAKQAETIEEFDVESPDADDDSMEAIGSYAFNQMGLACRDGNLDRVKELIANGTPLEGSMSDEIFEYDALYVSVMFGQPALVNYFAAERKEDVNGWYGESGMSLLCLACMFDDNGTALEMASALLNAGASVEPRTDFDDRYVLIPLLKAVQSNNIPLVKLLINHGADLTLNDYEGFTAFTLARQYDLTEIENLLLANYKTGNQLNGNGWLGNYALELDYGAVDEFASAIIGYNISITANNCTFSGIGYQTDFMYLCKAVQADDNHLEVVYQQSLFGPVFNESEDGELIIAKLEKHPDSGDYYIVSPIIEDGEDGVSEKQKAVKTVP